LLENSGRIRVQNICLLGLANTLSGGGTWWVIVGGIIQLTTWTQGRFAYWFFVYLAFCMTAIVIQQAKSSDKDEKRLHDYAQQVEAEADKYERKAPLAKEPYARRYRNEDKADPDERSPQQILDEYRETYKQKVASQQHEVPEAQVSKYKPPEAVPHQRDRNRNTLSDRNHQPAAAQAEPAPQPEILETSIDQIRSALGFAEQSIDTSAFVTTGATIDTSALVHANSMIDTSALVHTNSMIDTSALVHTNSMIDTSALVHTNSMIDTSALVHSTAGVDTSALVTMGAAIDTSVFVTTGALVDTTALVDTSTLVNLSASVDLNAFRDGATITVSAAAPTIAEVKSALHAVGQASQLVSPAKADCEEGYCTRCGADRSHGFSFCTQCGHSFGLS
jgi:carbonic anhydrase/acetyltransferase-like protein (isoleucine patch superfamily)